MNRFLKWYWYKRTWYWYSVVERAMTKQEIATNKCIEYSKKEGM